MAPQGGRDVKNDGEVGVGLDRAGLTARAQASYKKTRAVEVETLVSTDRFVVVKVPYTLCVALGINSETELATQITALGVGDDIKEFVPAVKPKTGDTPDKGRASTSDIDSIILSQKLIGTRYIIQLHTPIIYKVKGADKLRQWYSLRVPQVVSIAAFSLFLARFATANRMPAGFTTIKGSRKLHR